jgi:hypothetical protein
MNSQSPTPDMDRIKETLKKLAILAERGEENERETALLLLQKILIKYNLSVPDLVNPDVKEREFSFTSRDNLTVLAQCIWSVNKDAHISFDSGKNRVFVKLRSSDYIEVVEKVQFYFPLYEKEKMKLMLAFITKHGLTTETAGNKCKESMTEQEVRQIVVMMQGMDKSSFITTNKMIEKK